PFEELLRVPAAKRGEAEHCVTANGAEVQEADAVGFPAADKRDGGPAEVDPAAQGGIDRADGGGREYEKSAEQCEPPEIVAEAGTDGGAKSVGRHAGGHPFVDLGSARQELEREHAGERNADEARGHPDAQLVANEETVPMTEASERLVRNFENLADVRKLKVLA